MTRSSSAIPGTRIGSAGPANPLLEPRELAPRTTVTYWCRNGHDTAVALAADAEVPPARDCPSCGFPAGLDAQNPPAPERDEPYHTHLQYVKERRTPAQQKQILAERMAEVADGGWAR